MNEFQGQTWKHLSGGVEGHAPNKGSSQVANTARPAHSGNQAPPAQTFSDKAKLLGYEALLKAERQQLKREIARTRAGMTDYLYQSSKPKTERKTTLCQT